MKTISVFLLSVLLLCDFAWLCGGQANQQDLFSHFFPGMGKKSDYSGTSTSAHAEATSSVKRPGKAAEVEGKGDVSTQTKSIITTSARSRRRACKKGKCETKEEAAASVFETEPSEVKDVEAKEASSFSSIGTKTIDFEALKRKYFVQEEDDDYPDLT